MDLKVLRDGIDGRWTEQRHSEFLSMLETNFVRRVLKVEIAGGGGAVPCRHVDMNGDVRLNRHIPDSATESTGDSRWRPPTATTDSEPRCASTFAGKNTRKRSIALLVASSDQVVPDFENSAECEVASRSVKRRRGGGRF